MNRHNFHYQMVISFIIALNMIGLFHITDNSSAREFNIEYRLTNNDYYKSSHQFYGDLLVWQDRRGSNWDIYLMNISTMEETRVSPIGGNQEEPDIYGDIIVWQDDRFGNYDIYMYDCLTENETRLTSSPYDQMRPEIFEDKIIWIENQNKISNIVLYDLKEGVERQITDTDFADFATIWGNRVAYFDMRGDGDIILIDLLNGTEKVISKKENRLWGPQLYQDKLVYYYYSMSNSYLLLYDISNQTETRITKEFRCNNTMECSIWGDIIVWSDNRCGYWNIYMFNIRTWKETTITKTSDQNYSPKIYKDMIIWGRYYYRFDFFLRILDRDNDEVRDSEDDLPDYPGIWEDTDGDGHGDKLDKFPLDPDEWEDTDGDGYGDNSDEFVNDPNEWTDSDMDRWGDNRDRFPLDPLEWNDTDSDGVGDNSDVFPIDPNDWEDRDRDGRGDNTDAFPDDPKEWSDIDLDGFGDNKDIFPADVNEWNDTDGDGVGDNSDAFPEDFRASQDSDGDGYPDEYNLDVNLREDLPPLPLDQYPEDPTRFKKEDKGVSILWIIIVISGVSILFIAISATLIYIYRSKKLSDKEGKSNSLQEEIWKG